jgi:hypothetical protein
MIFSFLQAETHNWLASILYIETIILLILMLVIELCFRRFDKPSTTVQNMQF